jgi:hypothetical protein
VDECKPLPVGSVARDTAVDWLRHWVCIGGGGGGGGEGAGACGGGGGSTPGIAGAASVCARSKRHRGEQGSHDPD